MYVNIFRQQLNPEVQNVNLSFSFAHWQFIYINVKLWVARRKKKKKTCVNIVNNFQLQEGAL